MEIGDDGLTDNSGYETIIVPEVEDPYGGPNCSCNCHNVDDAAFKSRTRHCVPCGTKVINCFSTKYTALWFICICFCVGIYCSVPDNCVLETHILLK